MSRLTLVKPSSRPSSSRMGVAISWAQNRLPSLRTRHDSCSARPVRAASSRIAAGTPARRSSGVWNMSQGLPMTSEAS